MAERKRRRRSTNPRNSLYDEPSPWGVIAFIAVVVVAVLVVVFMLGSNAFVPSGISGGDRIG